MPEAGAHHVLNGSFLPIGQLDLGLTSLPANTGPLAASLTQSFWADAGLLPANLARLWWQLLADTGELPADSTGFRLDGLAVPLRITEMMVRLHEVVDREVVLAIVKPGAAPDDLLELDHRVDRAHQDNVTNVAGVHTGGELLRGGQDGRNGLFVVLEIAQVLLAQGTVVGRDPLAVVGICAGLQLVDKVTHGQCVHLGRAKDNGLLALVDLLHEHLDPVRLPLLDLDDPVEILFFVALAGLDLTLHHRVGGGVDVLIQRRGNLAHLERSQEAVVDAVLERVDEYRLAEVAVGVHIVLALGRGREAELHCRGEVVHDAAPVALVVRAAAMALVYDDEIEEVGWIFAEIRAGMPAFIGRPAHESLEDGEEEAAVLRHLALLADILRGYPHQRVLREGGEGVEGLVGEDIAVGQKQDAWPPGRLAPLLPIDQVPAAVEQLPCDLEGDEGLARARGQSQQDAPLSGGDGIQHPFDGDVLVITGWMAAAFVLERHGFEPVAPGVLFGKG